MSNLEDIIGTKVMDRTMVILDIFAQHATTNEGKIQVELALLRYNSTRLIGSRSSLSRQAGTAGMIGLKGPGEKKLELDRRLIRERIAQLEHELEDVIRVRETERRSRLASALPLVAIVGYTNTGKSTLLNALTDSDIYTENKLFATLDPTVRRLRLPSGQEALLSDTVGFIRKLPHHLIEAFRSTLEETRYADLILHVADASDDECVQHSHVVVQTLAALGLDADSVPIATVYNKCDLPRSKSIDEIASTEALYISAKEQSGLDALLLYIEEKLNASKVYIEKVLPFADAGKVQTVRKYGTLLSEEYIENGILIKAYMPKDKLHVVER
jgi:GTP-binding protein HflX